MGSHNYFFLPYFHKNFFSTLVSYVYSSFVSLYYINSKNYPIFTKKRMKNKQDYFLHMIHDNTHYHPSHKSRAYALDKNYNHNDIIAVTQCRNLFFLYYIIYIKSCPCSSSVLECHKLRHWHSLNQQEKLFTSSYISIYSYSLKYIYSLLSFLHKRLLHPKDLH